MASISAHHKPDASIGKGKCSVPMWREGIPAGFCDEPAFGVQTPHGERHYKGYVPALACPGHGGPDLAQAITGRVVIRFDGPPGPESGRFIEVERNGASIGFGDWVQDGDDWLLVLPDEMPARPADVSL